MPDLPALPVKSTVPCEEHSCHDCCLEIEMILTEDDLARLQLARPGEDFWFVADDGFLQLRTQAESLPSDAAQGFTAKPCWFLGTDGRCTVWSDRPAGCRLYPAMWDDELRQAALDDVYCPHTEDFLLPKAMDDATRRLALQLESELAARAKRTPSTA